MKYKRLEMSKPIAVKLDKPLLDRVKALSEKIGEAQSTVMRMAMRIGLDGLEKTFEASPADLLKLVSALEPRKQSSSVSYAPSRAEASRAEDKPSTASTQSIPSTPSSTTDPAQEVLRIVKQHYPKPRGRGPSGGPK